MTKMPGEGHEKGDLCTFYFYWLLLSLKGKTECRAVSELVLLVYFFFLQYLKIVCVSA
jgi:hypothetical protein